MTGSTSSKLLRIIERGVVVCLVSSVLAGILITLKASPVGRTYQRNEAPRGSILDGAPAAVYVGTISPNTASIEELMTIPGIGEKTARAIVEEREENGPFCYLQDLVAVKGIGLKKLEVFSQYFCLP